MVTVKGPGNKAPVELLTHPQRQLRYCASNWSNHAISPVTVLSYIRQIMGPFIKNATVIMSK